MKGNLRRAMPAGINTKRALYIIPAACIAVVAAFFALGGFAMTKPRDERLLVGYPTSWGSLAPALQHTRFADALMGNVFEPLVRNRLGVIERAAALSWSVSDDRVKYSFRIDTSRRFSNGEHLSARHFKSAWEHALRLPAKSSNSSLADVLYRVKGYSDFTQMGNLEGVRVLGDDRLEIEFSGPYRSALDDLAGNRYSAAIYDGDKVLGTGPYVLESEGPESAEFRKSEFAPDENLFEKVFVSIVAVDKANEALSQAKIDVYNYFGRGSFPDCSGSNSVKCISGPESAHQILDVNGLKGRFFEVAERRRALQALVWQLLREPNSKLLKGNPVFRLDPQFYLPLQAGRLSQEEVERLVKSTSESISQMVADSQKSPLYVITGRPDTTLIDALKKSGLALDPRSGSVPYKEALEDFYKLHKADLSIGGASVWNGDPDGAYHVLGRSGAITSPMIQRPAVADLLEEGRDVLNIEKLHAHYQKVSAAILTEVPFVHLGMVADQIAYRSDKVEANEAMLARTGNGLHHFRKK
jgi:ABC-type transport system substrate-binding protein